MAELQRVNSPELDSILGEKFSVLNDGFVRVVDYCGADESIVQAARVSCGKGTKQALEDEELIRYLLRHHHETPFEMCYIKFHVRVPMDCWRQWIRHRISSVSERSSRYSIVDDGAQQAGIDGWRAQARTNKQGSSGFFEKEDGEICSQDEKDLHEKSMEIYNKRINMGMAREQARKDLPLCSYTEAYWEVNLRSLFNFLFLRMDSHAQYEIRQYANIIAENIVSKWVPVAWKAFQDYQLNAMTLSAIDIELINIKSGLERFNRAVEIGWIDKEFADNYKTNKLTEKLPFNLERKEFNEKAKRLGLKDPFYLNILGLKE